MQRVGSDGWGQGRFVRRCAASMAGAGTQHPTGFQSCQQPVQLGWIEDTAQRDQRTPPQSLMPLPAGSCHVPSDVGALYPTVRSARWTAPLAPGGKQHRYMAPHMAVSRSLARTFTTSRVARTCSNTCQHDQHIPRYVRIRPSIVSLYLHVGLGMTPSTAYKPGLRTAWVALMTHMSQLTRWAANRREG